jgi:hypothetical protein
MVEEFIRNPEKNAEIKNFSAKRIRSQKIIFLLAEKKWIV